MPFNKAPFVSNNQNIKAEVPMIFLQGYASNVPKGHACNIPRVYYVIKNNNTV